MKDTLNAGLIGFGMIGKAHAFGYATLPFYAPGLKVRAKILGVATSRKETSRRAQETLGCPIATTDYMDLIHNPEIDVIHICTPNAEHFPALIAAIRAGKHIYCEKPIVSRASDASKVAEALSARAADGSPRYVGVTQTAFHLRGFTAIRRAKELIDAGKLGQIIQYRVGYYHSSMLSPTGVYRWKHGSDGGSILDLASHLLDLVDYLVGLPGELLAQTTTMCATRPIRALSQGETLDGVEKKPVDAEDAVTILTRGLDTQSSAKKIPLERTDKIYEYPFSAPIDGEGRVPLAVADPMLPGALSGVIEATKLSSGAEDDLRFEINGTRGSVRFSLMNSHYLEYFDGTQTASVNGGNYGWLQIACGARYSNPDGDFPSPKSTTGWIRAHVASLAQFYRSIEMGRALGPDLFQGLRVQNALEIVKESAATRNWKRV